MHVISTKMWLHNNLEWSLKCSFKEAHVHIKEHACGYYNLINPELSKSNFTRYKG